MTCRVGIVRRGIARLTRVTHAPCVCRSSFASDAHQSHVPTSSEVWKAGNVFQTLWDAICLKNYALFQGHDQYRHNIRTAVFWNFARSCRVLPATQYSTCHTCLRKQDTNMSVRDRSIFGQQTCQNMNMAVCHLKHFRKSNLPKHVSRPPVRNV